MLARGSFFAFSSPEPPSDDRFFSPRDSLEFGRELGAGGTGNAAILVTLRTVFAEGIPDVLLREEGPRGRSDVDADCGVGNAEGREGVLSLVGVAVGNPLPAEVDRG